MVDDSNQDTTPSSQLLLSLFYNQTFQGWVDARADTILSKAAECFPPSVRKRITQRTISKAMGMMSIISEEEDSEHVRQVEVGTVSISAYTLYVVKGLESGDLVLISN